MKDPELRTILHNLELGQVSKDWGVVDRAITRLAQYTLEREWSSTPSSSG